MCSATLYRQRQFEMDPTEAATVTIVVLGDWEIQGPKGKSQCLLRAVQAHSRRDR